MTVLLAQMAESLSLDVAFLESIIAQASHLYRKAEIKKRDGGTRPIFIPAPELRLLQRWLLRTIVARLPVHACATAYVAKKGTLDTASPHRKNAFVVRLDVKQFFPSITAKDINVYWRRRRSVFPAEWTSNDLKIFTKLVCRRGRLTIGAPTSPSLSNALCIELDLMLSVMAEHRELAYSRYADDMFFSSGSANDLQGLEGEVAKYLTGLAFPFGLKLNKDKTVLMHKGAQRRITGLVLTDDEKVAAPRELRRKIRAMLHQIDKLTKLDMSRLAGLLAYLKGVDPAALDSLQKQFPRQTRAALHPAERSAIISMLQRERGLRERLRKIAARRAATA